jgi:predicted kinase
VRLCHGDLHLRNIVLYNDHPLLFDAIEFDDTIATCDILYDFSFILMDLWQRGLKAHVSRLFNLYLWQAADVETTLAGLAALPFFLALRAEIRARVTVALCRVHSDNRDKHIGEARRFFAAAQSFLQPSQTKLVAVGGLSGTGKSTFAQELACDIGRAPGAVHLRSDIERKRLFNVGTQQRLPPDAYNADVTEKVYARLRDLAKLALEAGHSVIVDAVHAKAAERDALTALAQELGVPFAGFWLEAPAQTLIARVEARENDASDAKEAVVREQLSWDLGDIRWTKLDAGQSVEELRAAALKQLA